MDNHFDPTRRDFLKLVAGGAAGLAVGSKLLTALGSAPSSHAGTRSLPNIVMILVDDMGWSDIGCYGGEIDTPNLDRLARGGIRFTQVHNTSKCFPSRACLLTGIYAQQCGMARRHEAIENAVTLAEALGLAGYRTYMTGKHHGSENPYYRGFNHFYGPVGGGGNHFNPGTQRPGEDKPAQKGPREYYLDDKLVTEFSKDFYTTDYFTRYAFDFLDEHQRRYRDRPFLLYLAYTAPHDPLQAWPDDIAKYRGRYKSGYEAIRTRRYQRMREMQLIDERYPLSPPTHRPWNSLRDTEKDEEELKMAVYAAMTDRVDQKIGDLLGRIRQMGQEDNTLILFASDNGANPIVVKKVPGSGQIGTMTRWTSLGRDWANVSNTPFRYYKNDSYQGGICTPLIACWPRGITNPGSICHEPGHFIDIMPTFLQAAGGTYPTEYNGIKITPCEGVSLIPAFKGKPIRRGKPIYWEWHNGKAVREGKWKIVYRKKGPWELYDMDTDRTETVDLAAKYPHVVARMARMHKEWLRRCAEGME